MAQSNHPAEFETLFGSPIRVFCCPNEELKSTQREEVKRNGSPTIAGIWTTYRLRIAGTMGLLALERVLGVAVPFVLGVAINDLIAGSFRGIWWLIGLELTMLVTGTGRRVYDTRVYARIYTDIADSTAKRTETAVSRRAARLGLARELVDFFFTYRISRQPILRSQSFC